MALADRVVLMRDGRIEQQGPPEEIYHHPATLFAAQFFGQPPINTVPAEIVRADARVTELALDGDQSERVVLGPLDRDAIRGTRVTMAVRPEAFGTTADPRRIALAPRKVEFVEWFGGERHVLLGTGPAAVTWRTSGDAQVAAGDVIALDIANDCVHLFGSDGAVIRRGPLPND
jgi:multiple sugar transport system ATP-binding protein